MCVKGAIYIYIYEIVNILNNKKYIGKTKNFLIRKNRHLYELSNNRHHCLHLQRAWNKYGEENFIFNVLYSDLNEEEAKQKEEEMINQNYENLYNVSKKSGGGDLISYHPNVNDIKSKISLGVKRRYEENPHIKQIYSEKFSGSGNPMYGKHHTQESKEKMSETRLRKPQTYDDKRRKEISDLRNETYKNNPEIKEKISKSLKKIYDENPSLKEKISEQLVERWKDDEYRKKMSMMSKEMAKKKMKSVYGDGIYYQSITEAAEKNGLKHGTILNRIKSNNFPNWYFTQQLKA